LGRLYVGVSIFGAILGLVEATKTYDTIEEFNVDSKAEYTA